MFISVIEIHLVKVYDLEIENQKINKLILKVIEIIAFKEKKNNSFFSLK